MYNLILRVYFLYIFFSYKINNKKTIILFSFKVILSKITEAIYLDRNTYSLHENIRYFYLLDFIQWLNKNLYNFIK